MCVNSILATGIRAKEIQHDHKRWIVRSLESVDFVKKRGVQHREGEDYVRSVEGTVKHVRKTIGYEQGIFDA